MKIIRIGLQVRYPYSKVFQKNVKYFLFPIETTTTSTTVITTEQTLPPGCNGENIYERVCNVEHKVESLSELSSEVENHSSLIAEIQDENQKLKDALEELQNQVLILSTRPCSCR